MEQDQRVELILDSVLNIQTQLEGYQTLANETLARLDRIEQSLSGLDPTSPMTSGKLFEDFDLRDIAETLGL